MDFPLEVVFSISVVLSFYIQTSFGQRELIDSQHYFVEAVKRLIKFTLHFELGKLK